MGGGGSLVSKVTTASMCLVFLKLGPHVPPLMCGRKEKKASSLVATVDFFFPWVLTSVIII